MRTSEPLDGVLPVDKPVGPTSHDIVAMARRALRTRRIGHTGTLDPAASGLLLLCIGTATRLAEFLARLPKRYRAQIRLGQRTDTDDLTGRVIAESDTWRDITQRQFENALTRFRGDILQVPATFSAKKRSGERAYQAARLGKAVTLDPVPVHIAELRLVAWDPPYAELDVACSTGTYVRALARDIGEELRTGAHLTALGRTALGPYHVADALAVGMLADPARVRAALIDPLNALGEMPRISLDEEQVRRVRHGRALDIAHAPGIVALVAENALVAIAEADGERIRPRKVFSP
jgi:tRNA pseudouridine55 synthase